jgi:hypothetical protein
MQDRTKCRTANKGAIGNGFGSTNKARQKFLTSNSNQSLATVPGGTISKISHLQQYLFVSDKRSHL